MEKREAKKLLEKFQAGTCTAEEQAILESWYLQLNDGEFNLTDEELETLKSTTFRKLTRSRKKDIIFPQWISYAAAAIVLVALSVGSLMYVNQTPEQPLSTQNRMINKPGPAEAPGGNKALLTLADGSVVRLDEIKPGEISQTANVSIRKAADGQLIYEISPDASRAKTAFGTNKISTPRGGQYKIILPDGTRVWLNAASSLTYPVQFAQASRRVELSGEGYFEVNRQLNTHGERVPFFVSLATQTVEVLGTHFNISSYDDERSVKTTLLEGSVRVSRNASKTGGAVEPGRQVILSPGEQSRLSPTGIKVAKVDVEAAVAWKNGYFSFEQADLPTIMRHLSRWYDVDVVYNGKVSSETFTGKVYRNMTLSQVLDILDYAQVNFKIEGKKITIQP